MKKLYAALRLLLCCALSLSLGLPAYAGTTITYIHNDVAGSPVAASDSAGKLLWKESYYPYGEQIRHTGDSTNKVWFHGKPFDKTTGLSYFGARYYDPVIGRFMGMDPVGVDEGNIHSFNRYAYGNNNPYRFVDPNGMWAEDIVLAIPGFVMGAHSLGSNLSSGDYSGAAVDALGMVADGVALALPGIPGGAGLAVAATRKASSEAAKDVTYLYQKLGAEGEHLKYGIAKDPATRYTKEELAGGKLKIITEGSRKEMLELERNLHETLPIGREEGQKFYIQKQIDKGLKPPPYNQ